MAFSPEQLAALKNAITPAARASAEAGIEPEAAAAFLTAVDGFVDEEKDKLPNRPFLIVFDNSNSGKTKLDAKNVRAAVNIGSAIIVVDEQLRVINRLTGNASLTESTQVTEKRTALATRVCGGEVVVFSCGRIIHESSVGGMDSMSITPGWHHPISELKSVLDDHFRERVDGEKGFRYWHNKGKRILTRAVDGTEALFHQDLFWWVEMFVLDAISVTGEMQGLGQDKVDILIATIEGAYVVEVKWLGENESGTKYGIDKIEEGLVQVSIYIDNDDDLVGGYVVAYDGRPQGSEPVSQYDDTHRHNLCERPIVYFLRSDTPSQVAKATVGKARKAARGKAQSKKTKSNPTKKSGRKGKVRATKRS